MSTIEIISAIRDIFNYHYPFEKNMYAVPLRVLNYSEIRFDFYHSQETAYTIIITYKEYKYEVFNFHINRHYMDDILVNVFELEDDLWKDHNNECFNRFFSILEEARKTQMFNERINNKDQYIV